MKMIVVWVLVVLILIALITYSCLYMKYLKEEKLMQTKTENSNCSSPECIQISSSDDISEVSETKIFENLASAVRATKLCDEMDGSIRSFSHILRILRLGLNKGDPCAEIQYPFERNMAVWTMNRDISKEDIFLRMQNYGKITDIRNWLANGDVRRTGHSVRKNWVGSVVEYETENEARAAETSLERAYGPRVPVKSLLLKPWLIAVADIEWCFSHGRYDTTSILITTHSKFSEQIIFVLCTRFGKVLSVTKLLVGENINQVRFLVRYTAAVYALAAELALNDSNFFSQRLEVEIIMSQTVFDIIRHLISKEYCIWC